MEESPELHSNRTLLQSFEWHTPSEPPGAHETHRAGSHYARLTRLMPKLASLGVTSLWLPPGCKAGNPAGNGYDVYGLWDLGEFDWKGSRSTKWGSREELLTLLTQANSSNIETIWDAVLNHKAAADGTEQTWAVEVDSEDRRFEICEPKKIDAWLNFDFPRRDGKYSTLKWRAEHFNGTDWDHVKRKKAVYKLIDRPSSLSPGIDMAQCPGNVSIGKLGDKAMSKVVQTQAAAGELILEQIATPPGPRPGKGWALDVDDERGNFDYLMFSNIDYTHNDVQRDVVAWGEWMIKDVGVTGFRLDAARHFSFGFSKSWIAHVHHASMRRHGREAFVVGEVWTPEVGRIIKWLDAVQSLDGPRIYAYDSALLYNFSRYSETVTRAELCSPQSTVADLRTITDHSLLATRPEAAITLVTNHDTQPGQTCYTPMHADLKPLFYTFILLRKEGYPCVFWGDLFGTDGPHSEPPACRLSHTNDEDKCRSFLEDLMMFRKLFAHGNQNNYWRAADCFGWTREGSPDHDGCAVVISLPSTFHRPSSSRGDERVKSIRMQIGGRGETWKDALGLTLSHVEIDEDGFGDFRCNSKGVCIFVHEKSLDMESLRYRDK